MRIRTVAPEMKVGAFNAGLRVAGLGGRFALSLFMARYMSLQDVGTFALMTGVTGLLPSLVGLGLNFFLSRALVGMEPHVAIRTASDRLVVSVIAGIVSIVALAVALRSGWLTLPFPLWLAGAIMLFELLGFDMQMALLARSRSTLANFLLFLRTGLWTFPFMVLALVEPRARTIGVLTLFWLGGLLVSHIVPAIRYRAAYAATVRGLRHYRFHFARSVGGQAWKIYVSDLGLAGSVYIDRFIITGLIGIGAAGVYFFYASIVNSVYIICQAATVQVYQPQLRAAYRDRGIDSLHAMLRSRTRSALLLSVVALAAAGPAAFLVAKVTHKDQIMAAFAIMPILLTAYVFKVASEMLSCALAAAEQDRSYALFNVLGLVMTVVACLALIPLLGLIGVACANLLASAGLVALRWRSWSRFRHRTVAATADASGVTA